MCTCVACAHPNWNLIPFLRYNRKGQAEQEPLKTKQARNLTSSTFTRVAQQHHHECLSQRSLFQESHAQLSDMLFADQDTTLTCHSSRIPCVRAMFQRLLCYNRKSEIEHKPLKTIGNVYMVCMPVVLRNHKLSMGLGRQMLL